MKNAIALLIITLLAGCISPPDYPDETVGVYDIPTGELLGVYNNPRVEDHMDRRWTNSEDLDTIWVDGDAYWYPTTRVVRVRR